MKPKTVEKAVKILEQIKALDKLILKIESMAMDITSTDLVPVIEIKLREPQPKQGEFKMREPSETTFGMTTDHYIAPLFDMREMISDYMQGKMASKFAVIASNPDKFSYQDLTINVDPSNTLEILGVILREKIQDRSLLLEQLDKL